MAKGDTWMPFYVGDYLRDTGHLTTQEHGAYMLLLMHGWMRNGVLPDDDLRLRAICRLDARDWKRSRDTLRAFFQVTSEGLCQKRQVEELAVSRGNIEQKRAAGRASAEARALQRTLNDRSTAVATEQPTEQPTKPQRQTQRRGNPSPSPIPIESLSRSRSESVTPARDPPSPPPTNDAEAKGQQLRAEWQAEIQRSRLTMTTNGRTFISEEWMTIEEEDDYATDKLATPFGTDTFDLTIKFARYYSQHGVDYPNPNWTTIFKEWVDREVKIIQREQSAKGTKQHG